MLKVLFVSSGNSEQGISPIVRNQGESLRHAGLDVQYYPVQGKGLEGYLQAASSLKKHLRASPVDIVHAHYTLSGWTAVLSKPKQPIVLSLMGTDAYGGYIGVNKIKRASWYLICLTYMIQPFIRAIICKSKHIESFVYLKKKSWVIPNGILLDRIISEKKGNKEELGIGPDKRHILFLGNPESRRKNYSLAKKAVALLYRDDVVLVAPYPLPHDQVIRYLHSIDALVVPSLMEGSPNVVKEAMACNCPVVTTDVGDIRWLFGDEPGHFLCGFDPEDVANKLNLALEFAENDGRTNGRQRIIDLGLDSGTVAKRIVGVYEEVLARKERRKRTKRL